MSERIDVSGHLVLCLADRNPETASGLAAQEQLVDGGRISIRINIETFFLVNPLAWRDTAEDEQLLVFVPGPLGADVQLRAPKYLFQEVHTPSGKESNGST